MSTAIALAIDNFVFTDFEVPEEIAYPVRQQVVVQKLPGGRRVLSALGADYVPLSWTGRFRGPNAVERSRYLESLAAEGKPHTVTWDSYRYTAIISEFSPRYARAGWELPYAITLEIVENLTTPVRSFSAVSIKDSLAADNATAQTLGGTVGDDALTSALSAMDSAIGAVSDFASATTATIQSIVQPIAAVQARVSTLLASTMNTLHNIATGGGLLPSSPLATKLAQVDAQITQSVQQPVLINLQDVIGRMATNLGSFSGPGSATTTVGSTTLFDVAAAQYGDATKWTALAKANGLVDPTVVGPVTLKVPANPGDTGGVVQQ